MGGQGVWGRRKEKHFVNIELPFEQLRIKRKVSPVILTEIGFFGKACVYIVDLNPYYLSCHGTVAQWVEPPRLQSVVNTTSGSS